MENKKTAAPLKNKKINKKLSNSLAESPRQTHELQKLPKNKDANKKQEKVKKS